jgi:hypothetical protein
MTTAKEMVSLGKELQVMGYEVVLPEFTHDYAGMADMGQMHAESAKNKVKYDLIRGYFNIIKESDAILVVNIERKNIKGYIGGNSFLEMGFAFILNKPIYLLHEIPDMSYRDELEAINPICLFGDIDNIKKY